MTFKGSTILTTVLLASTALCLAQQASTPTKVKPSDPKTAAAQKLIDRAEVARKTGDLPTAIKLYRQAVVSDPENEKAHGGLYSALWVSEQNRLKAEARAAGKDPEADEVYKKLAEVVDLRLAGIYRTLAAAHPKVVAYQYHLAEAEYAQDWDKLRPALEKIVATHPRYAPALCHLSRLHEDNPQKARELLRSAMEIAPDNDLYAYEYAQSFAMDDAKELRRLAYDYVKRFPESHYGDVLLLQAANDSEDPAERQALLERIAERPNVRFDDLLALYARSDPGKAAQFAQKKVDDARKQGAAKRAVDSNSDVVNYYGAIARAQDLLKAGSLAEAKLAIDKVEPLKYGPVSVFPKVKLTSEVLLAQGKPAEAYKYLLDEHETIGDADLTAMAAKVGAQLGKSEQQANNEIVEAFLATGKPIPDFEVESLAGDRKIKLSDLSGKYVWVNTWHPT